MRDALSDARARIRKLTEGYDADPGAAVDRLLAYKAEREEDKTGARAWRTYCKVMTRLDHNPLPVTQKSLLLATLERRSRGVSMKDAEKWWGDVTRYCRTACGEGQDAVDEIPRSFLRELAATYPTAGYAATHPLTKTEMLKIRAFADRARQDNDFRAWQTYIMMAVGWHAALRQCEVLQLRAKHVMIGVGDDEGRITVWNRFRKTRKTDGKLFDTEVPLVPALHLDADLKSWAKHCDLELGPRGSANYLFAIPAPHKNAGKPYSSQTFGIMVRDLCRRAGLSHQVSARSMRYGGANRLLSEGIPEATVAAVIGWTSPKMLQTRYGRKRVLTQPHRTSGH